MKLMYDMNSVAQAAVYLEKHNSNGKEREEIAQDILDTMMKYAKEETSFVGTGGYLIRYEELGLDMVVAEVTVNSSFESLYVTVNV